MNAKQLSVISVVALAAALALWLLPDKAAVDKLGVNLPGVNLPGSAVPPGERGSAQKADITPVPAAVKAGGSDDAAARPNQALSAETAETHGNAPDSPDSEERAAERREKKLEQWDALVDRIAAADDVTLELGRELQSALNGLDPHDRLPAIHSALNLVPDGGFAVFVPLLFDKLQPEEILDALFNDMLNRDESVKVPLMKELRKDTTHPMFFESARILDATGVE